MADILKTAAVVVFMQMEKHSHLNSFKKAYVNMELSNQYECVLIKNKIQLIKMQLINLHIMLPLGLGCNETCEVGLLV